MRDNTPAFPQTYQTCQSHMEGMTLRDYFAAKALAALIIGDQGDLPHRLGAVDAYRYADETLEARK
jgi:hypothetical protein